MSEANRIAAYKIVSDMLDNPNNFGIYQTTKCYDALEALLDAKDSELALLQEDWGGENDKFERELAAIKADAERYRWLRNDSDNFAVHQNVGHTWEKIDYPPELDSAIDAAMPTTPEK